MVSLEEFSKFPRTKNLLMAAGIPMMVKQWDSMLSHALQIFQIRLALRRWSSLGNISATSDAVGGPRHHHIRNSPKVIGYTTQTRRSAVSYH